MYSGFNDENTRPDNIEKNGESIEHYFTDSLVNPLIVMKKNNIKNPFSLIDSDFSLGKLNKPFIPNQIPITISPELLVINYSLIKNFPKFIKPIMYTWHDATEENQQAFNVTLLKYLKNTFSKISSNMGFISLSSLHNLQIETISKLRADYSTGRIIFHHIGYGFPQLTADSIYLSGNIQISPKLLFILLTPPTLYIFDCDNAGSVLPVFESIAASRSVQNWQDDSNRQKKLSDQCCFSPFQCLSNSVNWSDYFILCATSPGEELPRDPNLPCDFFTSVLFSPVQTAFLCQVYLSYRTTITFNDIPKTTIDELEELLDVIVDGISCECLPGPSLHHFFRGDKVIHTLFRNFVLAQYVLKPFGVHPVSSPPLPDMSNNQLWEQWKAAVDNSIGVFATTRSPTRDYFDRALTSFNYLYAKSCYSSISPSLITALFRSGNYEGPAKLIIDYPSSIEVIASIIVISDLFMNLMKVDPTTDKFKDICMIIIYMLKFDMNFTYQIPNELDWDKVLAVIFDSTIDINTRSLVASIASACVPYHKSLRFLCTNQNFANQIKFEISKVSNPPFFTKWLLILFKRSYDVFSADISVFKPNGLHIQCAICILHYSQEVRASAISCLSCFMQGDDPQLNLRLLLSAIPAFTDISYLVRHQLLMLILRYLTTHHDLIETNQQLGTFDYSSFKSLTNSVFGLPEISQFVAVSSEQQICYDNIINFYRTIENDTMTNEMQNLMPFSPQRINELIQFAVTFFAYDPHPAIAAEAASAREFFFRRGNKKSEHSQSNLADENNEEEDYSESDSLLFIPFESDSDAIYQISLRQMLERVSSSGEKRFRSCFPNDNWSKQSSVSLKVECPLYGRPSSICFDSLSTGVIVAGDNDITYYDDNLNITSSIHISSSFTTDLKSGSWFNESLTLISCGNGCMYVFKIGEDSKKPIACFRADPNIMAASIPLYCSVANDKPRIATVRGTNNAVLWDMETLRIIQEVPPQENLPFLSAIQPAISKLSPPSQQTLSIQLSPFLSSSSSSSSFSPSISPSLFPDFDVVGSDNGDLSSQSQFNDPTTKSLKPTPNATSIAVHPSNSNLLMVGYENGYAVITDLRDNLPIETICVSGAENQSPVIKVLGNIEGNSTFYAVSRNGSCIKWSPNPSPFANIMKRKFSMPSIRTGITSLMPQETVDYTSSTDQILNENSSSTKIQLTSPTSDIPITPKQVHLNSNKKSTQPNSRRVSLLPSTPKDMGSGNSILSSSSDTKAGSTCVRSNIPMMTGVEVHDFDAHPLLPIIAFSPENLNDQLVLNETTGRSQKVKMDPGSRCAFHPTQPIIALASGRKLKIFRL